MLYRHILLVTDLLSDADVVAARARHMMTHEPDTTLSVLHIVQEDMVRFGYELVPASSLSNDFDTKDWVEARTKLTAFLERNDLRDANTELITAISNAKGIVDYCKKYDVDLLIIGRHERRGITAWLVGATADEILPKVPCDSLVVKLDKPVDD